MFNFWKTCGSSDADITTQYVLVRDPLPTSECNTEDIKAAISKTRKEIQEEINKKNVLRELKEAKEKEEVRFSIEQNNLEKRNTLVQQQLDEQEIDEFRGKKPLQTEEWLTNLREWIFLPDKFKIIQKGLKTSAAAEIEYCFDLLEKDLVTYASDQIANHAIQSLMKQLNSEQLASTFDLLFTVDSIVALSCNSFSNHVLQQFLQQAPSKLLNKAIDIINTKGTSLLEMACDNIGNHVIQCCIKLSPSNLHEMSEVLSDPNILPRLATNRFGNHVLRCIISNELSDTLREALWLHWVSLSFNKFGNLCIQQFISKIPAEYLEKHANDLASHLRDFACDKFANHVLQGYVDQAVRYSNDNTIFIIVNAMKEDIFELGKCVENCLYIQSIFILINLFFSNKSKQLSLTFSKRFIFLF